MTGWIAGSPSIMAVATTPRSSAPKPARAALSGLTLKTTAGPLVVFSIPSSISTIGLWPPMFTFMSASATCGAQSLSRSGLSEKSFTTTGWGAPVRSPIMSCSNWTNSISSTGSSLRSFSRISLMTSSIPRFRSSFSLTVKSPVLGSVTGKMPSCKPVRREVLSTSGVARMIRSTWLRTRFVSSSELPAGMT